MKITTSFVVVIYALCVAQVFAQNPVQLTPNVIPPSPTAGELGRYGTVPLGLSTGTITPQINLYDFKTKNLSIPISLSYNGSAIRVDEVSSWVGMHWSLNAGGVITRIVRDDPDETTYFDSTYPDVIDSQSPTGVAYLEQAANNPLDTEPDVYSYNFGGRAGKFVFDRDGSIILMPANDLIIQKVWTSSQGSFIITTPDGVKYTFGAAEYSQLQVSYDAYFSSAVSSWYLTRIEHPVGDVINLTYSSSSYTYYLGVSQTVSRNTTRNGCAVTQPVVYCEAGSSSFSTSSMFVTGKRLSKIDAIGYGSVEFTSSAGRADLNDYKLDGLIVKNEDGLPIKSVSLGYQFSNNTTFLNSVNTNYQDLQHRMFLVNVVEKDKVGNQVRKHGFEYEDIDGLPARLSYAQDHWGYFNGVNNYDFLPTNRVERDFTGGLAFGNVGGDREPHSAFASKGMLTRITYPTGGYTTFKYEPNTYWGPRTILPPSIPVNILCNSHESILPIVKTTTILSTVAQTVQIHAIVSLLQGYTSTQKTARIQVFNEANTLVLGQDLLLDVPATLTVDLAANQHYTIRLTAISTGDDENNTFSQVFFNYIGTPVQVVNDNIETGGMRLNSSTNYDPVTQTREAKTYYYGKHDALNVSSGRIALPPDYVTKYFIRIQCGASELGPILCNFYDCPYVALHSNNVSNQFLTGTNIYYSYVTIARGGDATAGLEEHEFTISFDNIGTRVWGQDYVKDSPLSNTGWDNNLETAVRYYSFKNNSPVLVKSTTNLYVNDPRFHKEVKGLVTRKKYEPTCRQEAVYHCDASNVTKQYRTFTCTTNHDHAWLIGGGILSDLFSGTNYGDETICIASDAHMEWVVYLSHPCYGKTVDSTAVVSYYVDYVDAVEYLNISDWVHLDKTTETVYDQDGSNPVVTEVQYYYDNEDYRQLSRKLTTTSEGKQLETIFKYSYDYSSAADPSIASLLNKAIFGVPLKTESTLNGNLIDGNIAIRNVNGQIINQYKFESNILAAPTTHDASIMIPPGSYQLKSTIDFDAATNNPSRLQLTNNNSTIYLWGYRDRLPIAEVKGIEGAETVDSPMNMSLNAAVSEISIQSPIGSPINIFSTQSILTTVNASPQGSSPPTNPNLIFTLKKSDGTVITTFTVGWGSTNLPSVSLQAGSYRWHYSITNVAFSGQFPGFNISGQTSFTTRKPSLQVFHTSFEEDGTANSAARTGTKVWSGEYTLSLPATNGSYKLSYWKKTESNSWTLIQQDVTITSNAPQTMVIGSNGSIIDEVRFFPVNAQMTTYTYDPMIGATSMTDVNNITTYFSYDDFGRLSSIIDNKGNLLKSYTYHYKGQ